MMLSEYLTGTVAVLSVLLDLRWQGHGKLWLARLLLVSGCHWLPLCPYLNFREISKKVIRLIVFNFGQVVWVLAAISFKDGMPASANSSSWFLFHGFSDGSGSWSKSVQSLFNAGPFLVPFFAPAASPFTRCTPPTCLPVSCWTRSTLWAELCPFHPLQIPHTLYLNAY